MSEYIQVEFEGPDAVSYDPATKTATYLASGLSVQFLDEDPPIKDSQTYFRLRSPEGQCDFEVMRGGEGAASTESFQTRRSSSVKKYGGIGKKIFLMSGRAK